MRVEGQEGEVIFIRAELWRQSCPSQTRVFFWNSFLLHPSARKLAYDAKAFLSSLVGVLPPSIYLPLSLRMVDPIVGCWLLQPDHPVSSFLGCVKIILSSTIVSNPGSDQTAATHREMDLLADLARELFRRLKKVNLWSLFYQLEMRILPVLVSMERFQNSKLFRIIDGNGNMRKELDKWRSQVLLLPQTSHPSFYK